MVEKPDDTTLPGNQDQYQIPSPIHGPDPDYAVMERTP